MRLFPPHSSVVGPAVGQSGEDGGQTPQARSEPLRHPLHLLLGTLLLPLGPRHTGGHVCPLPPGTAGGHGLHAGPRAGLGRCGEPLPPAARQTVCDRCGLWLGHGLLSVQCGGEVVGDLGLPAGPAAGAAEPETQQGLRGTLDGRLETLVLLELFEWGKFAECV